MKRRKFQVTVNPFLHSAEIFVKIGKAFVWTDLFYKETDEWASFSIGDKVFDVHFYYDDEFSVSIYSVVDNQTITEWSHKVKLIIKLKD